MADHTQEPWLVTGPQKGKIGGYEVVSTVPGTNRYDTHPLVAMMQHSPDRQHVAEADARRIVACVNACAGIPTEALEAGAIAALVLEARDASVMFDNIERNRNMPPEARTLQQYVAAGKTLCASLCASLDALGDLDSWAQVRAMHKGASK